MASFDISDLVVCIIAGLVIGIFAFVFVVLFLSLIFVDLMQ